MTKKIQKVFLFHRALVRNNTQCRTMGLNGSAAEQAQWALIYLHDELPVCTFQKSRCSVTQSTSEVGASHTKVLSLHCIPVLHLENGKLKC